ncbi:SH2 domain-containing protein B isoform X2 [Daucus carota subsp. sativus]|uniref:SH2 domain-containing protein B isoform X2 n=1 Tax=Daucus carota subsp. sativus TaxID=79200 RepID=UPI0007B268D3|nr:PREDICTED: uncharacterized protein LOC108218351 [Daucus carota subsp. sativus]
MGSSEMERKYSLLKDLNFQVNVNQEDESSRRGFFISFWLYISTISTSFPSVILYQADPDKAYNVPFLGLSANKKLMLFPLPFLHQEAPSPTDPVSWIENTYASSKTDFPLKKWVHVGCEVSIDFVRIYTNGVLVGEKPLSSTSEKGLHLKGPRTVSLSSTHKDIKVNYEIQGYVYGVEVLSHASDVKDHYLKDPPLELSIDESSALDIDEDNDGVGSIVCGKDNSAYKASLRHMQEIPIEAEHCPSGSESNEATMSNSRSMSSCKYPVSDSIVFKYCLDGPSERSLMLREIAMLASEQELLDFAEQVSMYSGCFHHRHQIVMSKKLLEDGTKTWNLVSEKNKQVLWENLAPEIEEQFKKISCCNTRYLSLEDLELLRKIAGCQDLVTRENFERLWHWLYPVASTISQEWIKAIWDSVLPKWIEGLISKEEAEASLQGNGRFQDPGTFVLRFPTSRSWPHPDAGSLAVTYVGCDYSIHHKLLSLDLIYSSGAKETNAKPLKEMLLEEPELSRLGRIRRTF